MRQVYYTPLTICALVLLGFTETAAQETEPAPSEKDGGWFSFGIGKGYPYDVSSCISANFGHDKFWQLALNGTSDITLFGGTPASTSSFSIGVGYSAVDRVGRIATSVGPGIVWGDYRREGPGSKLRGFITPGLIANVQFAITPFKAFGLGLDVYSNFNLVKTVGGIRLVLFVEGNK